MRRFLLVIGALLMGFMHGARAQSQKVNSGVTTQAVNFAGVGCTYNWVNDSPGIGLPASGTGNLPAFTAVNNTGSAIIANITATPLPTGLAFISNYGDNTVTVIDVSNNSIAATITGFTGPWGVAISPDGSRAYVTNYNGNSVSVINTSLFSVITTIPIPAGSNPIGAVVSPDGSQLFVTNLNGGTITSISTNNNSVSGTYTGLSAPQGIVTSPDGTILYVANAVSNTVKAINVASHITVATISVDAGPLGEAISADGSTLYVANNTGNTVSVINTISFSVIKTIPVTSAGTITISPDGTKAYVSQLNGSAITIINTATNTVAGTISAGPGFFGVSMTSDGTQLYAVNGSGVVEDIDVATNATVATVPVGMHPTTLGNFISKGLCNSPPVKFTITVNAAPPTIIAQPATGFISACAGTPSVNPQVQLIFLSGSDLTGDITATAPAGFEVSLNQNSGYSNSVVLPQNGGLVGSGVYVRSSAPAPVGGISGNVALSSPGAVTQQVPVAGIINAVPKVNAVSPQVYNTGDIAGATSLGGAANNFTWTNDTPGIGLASSGNGSIPSFTAVNTGTTPVVATITVNPVNSGAAFVPNYTDGTVSVINTTTHTVEGTIAVGANPTAVAVSPDGKTVFVANHGETTISAIDVASNATVAIFFNGTEPNTLTITPDGKTLYVANDGSNTVSVIDAVNYQVITDVIVGLGAYGIAASPDSKFVYVANTDGNSVSVISTATNTVIATIPVPNAPHGIAVSTDGSKVYVTNYAGGTVTVISTITNAIAGTIAVGASPDGVAVSDDGKLVYVTNNGSNTVSVINAATSVVTATIAVGSNPAGVAFTAGGTYAYITNQNGNTVSIINTATKQVIATVPVGGSPISFGNFITASSSCPGTPATFTITVNPAAAAQPTVTTSPVIGSISACVGTASASPWIQQFTISGSNLIDNISATVPSFFEISTSPTTGFGSSVTLMESGGTVNPTTVYIRSSATANAGVYTGPVSISSVGWITIGQGPIIYETINALPTVNTVPDQIVNNGALTAAVSFSGTGNSFTWTNDTPAIGLPASGAGDIPSFTATNTGSSPLVATISATPINSGFAYLTRDDGTVAVLNTISGQVISSITVANTPAGVIMGPAGSNRAYIANPGSSTVSLINTTNNKLIRTIPVSGGGAMGMAVSKNGKFLYVADAIGGLVSVISLATSAEITTIPIGFNAYGLALSLDDSKLYATNFTGGLGFVSVINTATNTVITTVNTELYPTGIAISPDGSRVYAVDQISGAVSIISTATNTILATVNVGKGATGIVVSPDGSKVYVSNSGEATVSVINTATNSETLKIVVGSNPVGISVNADGSLVYVANTGSRTLSVINTATNAVVNTFSIPHLSQSFGNFILNGSGCQGAPVQFTITVNPSPGAPPTITASAATGSISACAGTASISPQVQQITISGNFLKSNITATAPAGFEISLSPNSGYASLLTIKQSGGAVGNTIIYVRSSATAPMGNIIGNITVQSLSATSQTIAVSGVVNALPNINPVSNQAVTNGQTVTAVNFTGTGTFTWTNDKPGIGLAASGNGNIAAFTAINTGTTPVTANISVTAKSPGYAYITGGGHTGQVYVVNTATQSVVATVPVGSRPVAVAFSPSGDKVYVTNDSTDYVSVIDTKTNNVVDTMYVGINMVSTCISPDGNPLYVTYNYGIAVINTSTGQQITKIFDRSLAEIIASPDGQYVYATNYDFDEVDVISTATNTIVKKIDVGFNPGMLVLSPDAKTLYVTAMGNVRGVVAVVDLATSTLVSSIPLGARPNGIAITPDGKKLYVTEEDVDKVAVIDIATNQVANTIAVGSYPQGVSITNDGSEVYITNVNSNDVSIINTATDQLVKTIPNIKLPEDIGDFIAPTPNCTSQPLRFTITVNPTPAQVPTITASTATGSITACAGTASVSPQIQQFTVSGKYLAGDITATAPAGFEVSLSPGSGYGPNVKLTQASGTVNNTIIYVRSSASAPAGDLNGAVTLISTTTTQFVDVHGIVNALATVNPIAPQVVTNGTNTTAINFGGTGNSFSWTNDTPGIGIAASSTGDIPAFTAHNFGTTPIVATFTVTPEKDALAYVANGGSKSVTVIDTKTNKIIATIAVGDFPWGAAASADGRVYVSNSNSGDVSVISSATNTVITTVPVAAGLESIAVSPDGNTVYVLSVGTETVYVINTGTYAVTNTIKVGQDPQYMALSPDGTKLVVANTSDFNLSVIDTKTNIITATIPLTFPPYGIGAGTDNNTVYVDDSDNGKLVTVNTSSKQVVASVAVGYLPRGVTVSPDGSRVYVGNTGENTVSVINTSTNVVTATVTVGTSPWGMSVTGDGNDVYVASKDNANVSVISTGTNAVVSTIGVGSGPYSIGNFITPGIPCPGPPTTFTITVNPTPSTSPDITASPVTGGISACAGTASASPQLQQVTVSGSNLIDNITASVPTIFEISTSPNSGFSSSVVLPQTGGTVNPTTLYIRSKATAPVGTASGYVTLSSVGWTPVGQGPAITETVRALPTVNTISNQTRNNGQTTAAVNFTGTGDPYIWTNDMPGIGLAASGSGNILPFTAVNTGATAITATVTATPTIEGLAYIDDYSNNAVTVINPVTNTVIKSIPVGTNPWGVVISPDGSRVYITNFHGNSVSVIDTKSNTVIATVGVGTQPYGLTVSADGSRIYVGAYGGANISVIDAVSLTVIATITGVTSVYDVVLGLDGSKLYAVEQAGQVAVINLADYSIITTIPVGVQPIAIAITPDGSQLYVTNAGSATVSVINTATNTVTATLPVGVYPSALAVSPDGGTIYVGNLSSNYISVINTATNTVEAPITNNSTSITGLSVSSDGAYLYAVNLQGSMFVISTASDAIINSVTVPPLARGFGKFIASGGCPGSPVQFTITVNPTAAALPAITAGPVTGTISACAGTASVSPQIQQFTVAGSNLAENITATAPANFEVSLSSGSGYGSNVTVSQTAGTAANTTIYVRASATATTGSISGKVTLTSAAAMQNVVVNGVVNALPTVNTVGPKTATNGGVTTPINFTGTGNTFTWTNDTPGIGLAASGTGGIPAFTAVNTTAAPITATVTVTPASSGAAYVSNYGSGTVSVINTTTNQLEKNITVDKNPWGVAISPDGSKVYVTSQAANSVSVIDAATNTVTAKINVGMSPEGVAISPDGRTLYVADNTGTSLSIINTATNAVSTITVGTSPQGLAISPDGTKLYVANATSNNVSVVNTADNSIAATINVGSHPFDVAVSPNGATIYVTNLGDNTVSVIDASTHSVTTVPVGTSPGGLCISPDGSRVYVANGNSKNISVINTADNSVTTLNFGSTPDGIELSGNGTLLNVTSFDNGELVVMDAATGNVVSTVAVGQFPAPIGNFIRQGTGCSGIPGTFTITVSPSPVIIVGQASGSITACQGSASANPNIQQFTVSGNSLTNDITLDAPIGFEISLSSTGGYNGTLTLPQTGGIVGNTIIYVRSAASAPAGTLANTVQLTSPGAANQTVDVAALINPAPTVGPLNSPTFVNAISTTPIVFTGTGTSYSWTNSSPAIGLPASGVGDIPSFTAVNTGTASIIANIIVNAQNASGCPGTPATFTITVTPTPVAAINTSGTLSPLTTTYGTPSPSESFSVSGTALTGGVLVTPPPGFEVSTDNANFATTVTVGSGTFSSTPVYIRLAATTPVSQNGYSGNIVLTNAGAPPINVPMPLSTVTPTPLTIFADDKVKIFDTPNPVLTASYIGFVNNEGPSFLTNQPLLSTTALLASPPGQYIISISGASSPNYAITTFAGVLTVQPVGLVVPNTFTPNGDGVNDTWNINFLNTYANCTVDIFTRWGQKVYTSIGYGIPWDGTYKGSALPIGTYYYIINLKNGASPLSGFVALIR